MSTEPSVIENTDDNYLLINIANKSYRLQVIGLDKAGIHLAYSVQLQALSRLAPRLEQSVLWLNGRRIGPLDLELLPALAGAEEVIARSPDDETSDLLWLAHYQLKQSNGLEPGQLKIDEADLRLIPQRGQHTEAARLERLNYVRERTGARLDQVAASSFSAGELQGNLEAYIGSVEVPVGVAGPLWINGQHAQGVFYAPIATSEGALVASITRGARALSKSGGVTTHVFGQRMIRVPVFKLNTVKSALFFADWLRDHFDQIKTKTKEYSNYAELIELEPQVQGKSLHVHFVYETGDAAGQNMTTTCTWNACLWILERMKVFENLKFESFFIEANLSNDKKVTFQSFIKGRGIRVQAEAFLPVQIVKRLLKVTPEQLFSCYQSLAEGGLQAGMVGFNVNIANLIAGLFISTGQDVASVHECAIGHLHMEQNEDGIYACMTLPSLVLGTVGGGTSLPQQRECLEMLGCAGAGKVSKLAEIIAAFSLGLDLSTLAALAGGQFAVAHEKLGRNRPIDYLAYDDLTPEFFSQIISETLRDETLKVTDVCPLTNVKIGSSIVTELSAQGNQKLIGLFPYRLTLESATRGAREVEVMIKSKPRDQEVIQMIGNLAALAGADLTAAFKQQGGRIDFLDCHLRELAIFEQNDERFTRHTPKLYGVYRNDEREIYLLIEERLRNMELMDSADDVSGWKDEHIFTALDAAAEFHSIWLNREDELRQQPWFSYQPNAERMQAARALWELLAIKAHEEFPEWFLESDLKRFQRIVRDLPDWWQDIDTMPKTLTHNDFNPRNITFRRTADGLHLCAYDWELASINIPQHDLAELLIFVLDDQVDIGRLCEYVEYHRQALQRASGETLAADLWWQGFHYALNDLLINRVAMYTLAHAAKHYDFMERIFTTLRHLLNLLNQDQEGKSS